MRKVLIGAVAGLSGLVLAAGPLSAATYTIDLTDEGIVLSSQDRAFWDMSNSTSTCSALDGFSPSYDGTYLGSSDGFDGGFVLEFGGTDFKDPDDLATKQGKTIDLGGAAVADGLRVSAVVRGVQTSPTLQYLVKLRNPGNNGVTSTVQLSTDLGSDSGTTILRDSSGDSLHASNDRWLVSGDAAAAPFGDPIVTQVTKGKKAKAASTVSNPLGNTDECMVVDFTVKVPAGATRYMLFFAQLHDNSGAGKNAAIKDAGKFDRQKSMTGALKGISPKLYSKIVNWNLKK